ncbi:G5 domain-containing protein [Bifidobacterium scardovii]|mgnify:CR=1 FL=1|uniref:G5 domain-containing protein n=1 Tax=Bifidobacterium scardovii TaxID=158787 RepID=A0A087D8M3_9BIFI|nr:G5 domain-containing protein [Bifidobacterium scardovii]KFI91873.1 G5 domain-containing protein [Bifidobacterium scardovii]MBS6947590.1 G5 domain-containing protein [Bifidobacterium scardovii]MDK6350080.1 G5 domain-containing protein [Bifidobacterium scardovii]MDU2421100.1 G5 domain-containing protein [Bifidobacterium scardovii]MDU3736253.1 G5 domain-containing protein [Bifidobacterium scardovii]
MANHSKRVPTLRSLSKRQWMKITAVVAATGMLAGAGIVSRNFYAASQHAAQSQVTSYSATDADALQVSRGEARESMRGADKNTTYVTVKINGESRTVLGSDFTDVKSVLDAGNITLEPDDSVSPQLTDPVSESTVITIQRAGTQVETNEEPIAFNTVKKETDSLPQGQEKVENEGEEGVMETTSLVTRSGDKIVSSNVFTSYVKKAPVDKVILVGTGSTTPTAAAANIGTTVPAGDMQSWAHDYLLANGYSEADFTATVYIINHESGWRVNATNASSGAYGLAQALPGSKMASVGADWATNYQTQLKWFWNYCASRYGSIQGAYSFWTTHHWY